MYKVIIVDDEEVIRQGLRTLIDWKGIGLNLVAEASNGLGALECIEKYKPHILVTDVKMPGMNGIELIKTLHEKKVNIKKVIISGYNDFEFVKDALKYSVSDYILKPINEDDLSATLTEIVKDIDNKILSNINNIDSLELIKTNTFNKLINSSISKVDFIEKITFLGMDFNEGPFNTLVIEIDGIRSLLGDELEFRRFTLNNVFEDISNKVQVLTSFYDRSNRLVVLVRYINNEYDIDLFAKRIKECVKEYLEFSVTVGVGGIAKNIMELKKSYEQGVDALRYKFTHGVDSIIHYDNVCFVSEILKQHNFKTENFEKYLKFLDKDKAEVELENIFRQLISIHSRDLKTLKDAAIRIVMVIMTQVNECGEDFGNIISADRALIDVMAEIETFEELKILMAKILNKSIELMTHVKERNINNTLCNINEYIKENFKSDLTLKSISEHFYMNPAYIGRIFKEEKGEAFSIYLNKLRIEAARKMLLSTNLMIYEVSLKCGYRDINYFRSMFKKITGINPGDLKRK